MRGSLVMELFVGWRSCRRFGARVVGDVIRAREGEIVV